MTTYVAGLPYEDDTGVLIVEEAAPVAFAPGGIGIGPGGGVSVDQTGEITHYNAGLPCTAEGALAIEIGGVELLGAFDGGFDEGYD